MTTFVSNNVILDCMNDDDLLKLKKQLNDERNIILNELEHKSDMSYCPNKKLTNKFFSRYRCYIVYQQDRELYWQFIDELLNECSNLINDIDKYLNE